MTQSGLQTASSGNQEQPSNDMSDQDKRSVDARSSGSAKVVHEVVRLQGDEELGRPLRSLMFSGFAAGVAIWASLLTESSLRMRLPDAMWADLVIYFGYPIGFIIVILGKLQLFTESTVTAVLPFATHRTLRNFTRLLRLWVVVFAANMAGSLFVAFFVSRCVIVSPEQLAAVIVISKPIIAHDWLTTLSFASPAGFLIASIAWSLPNARGAEFWVILIVTYAIALGGFSHVVAGSAEAWVLMLTGHASPAAVTGGFILPALLGNVLGGTGLFAIVAHGQVRGEIETSA